jgi:hypothetical protein
MSYWSNADQATAMGDGMFGLRLWHDRVKFYFSPTHCFVACGTWSDPTLSPLPSPVAVVNAGVSIGAPYDVHYNQLSLCALTAAMAYALNHRDEWDLLVCLDTDALVGAVDFDALLREFLSRDETLLSPSWWDGVGGPLLVWKHEGAVRLLHRRLRANLIDPPADANAPKPLLPEEELAAIYKGTWWQPWPQHRTLRQDHGGVDPFRDNAAVLTWPFVRFPDPAIVDEYTRTQTALAKPVA